MQADSHIAVSYGILSILSCGTLTCLPAGRSGIQKPTYLPTRRIYDQQQVKNKSGSYYSIYCAPTWNPAKGLPACDSAEGDQGG